MYLLQTCKGSKLHTSCPSTPENFQMYFLRTWEPRTVSCITCLVMNLKKFNFDTILGSNLLSVFLFASRTNNVLHRIWKLFFFKLKSFRILGSRTWRVNFFSKYSILSLPEVVLTLENKNLKTFQDSSIILLLLNYWAFAFSVKITRKIT